MPMTIGLPPRPPVRRPRPARTHRFEPGDQVWFLAADGLRHAADVHCLTYAGGDRLMVVVRITDGSLRRAPADAPEVQPRAE